MGQCVEGHGNIMSKLSNRKKPQAHYQEMSLWNFLFEFGIESENNIAYREVVNLINFPLLSKVIRAK